MNIMRRIPMDTADALDRIRRDLDTAISGSRVAAVIAARENLARARADATVAQDALAAAVRDARARGDKMLHPSVERAEAKVEAASEVVKGKRAAVVAAIEAASPKVRQALTEPVAELQGVILAQLTELETTIDPLVEVFAGLSREGIDPPPLVAASMRLQEHVRAMRLAVGGR